MIRITVADEPARSVIIIDGQLSGESIAAVETCCRQAISRGKPVEFRLRDVSTLDGSGRDLMRRLAAAGVVLSATGVYTAYVVDALEQTSERKTDARSFAGGSTGEPADGCVRGLRPG